MNVAEYLEEQLPERRTSNDRWGRGKTDEEKAALAAAFLKRTCGKCGAFWTGTFDATAAEFAAHAKAGCR